ncbi:MAG: 50S ribosomal protein L22 [Candidatus Babeliales bacterium]|jgi:large subunit ribosomal protein L22
MQFVAKAKRIPFSPYKLRPLADVVRGKGVDYALGWLATHRTKRVSPLQKVIESAAANARNLQGVELENLCIKEIKVDEGRTHRYFKPGAMGRASEQKKRFSHISVILEQKSATTRKA